MSYRFLFIILIPDIPVYILEFYCLIFEKNHFAFLFFQHEILQRGRKNWRLFFFFTLRNNFSHLFLINSKLLSIRLLYVSFIQFPSETIGYSLQYFKEKNSRILVNLNLNSTVSKGFERTKQNTRWQICYTAQLTSVKKENILHCFWQKWKCIIYGGLFTTNKTNHP